MKQTLFIILFLFSLNIFGQKLTEKIGEIEVQLIGHRFKQNSDGELTNKKTNKKNRPFSKMYFDSTGILLKSVSFGKHHNTDLRLTNKINVFEYTNSKLSKSVEYESDYENIVYPYYKSKYIYNKKDELIDESTYYYKTDSLFFRTTYEYDLNSNKVKSIFNPTYYYYREFDSINRVIVLKQIYDSKLRWDWNYKYSNNQRIGIFQTYYNDGKDYSKKEIQTYNIQGLLIETEEIYVSISGVNEKTKIYYYNNGLIKRIERFQSYSTQNEYEMISYSEVKIKSKIKVDSEIAERINKQINIK
nr:hypothetical protein [uncultured Flavobacterium sp.]